MNLFLGTDEGLAVFDGQEEEWHPHFLRLQTREITAALVTGNIVWAGTTDGLWRSYDKGATWSPVRVGAGAVHVRSLAAHPGLPGMVLVGTEPASIIITRDRGKTWTEVAEVSRLRDTHGWSLPYSPAAGCIRGFVIAGQRIYAAVEVGGVLRSDDLGGTWRLVEDGIHLDVHHLSAHHADPNIVYAATGGGRYRSDDGGENWRLIGDGYTRAIWTDPARPGVVLAGPARYVGGMGRIERSIDGGETWTLASDGLKVPMTDMIERFTSIGTHLLAITSDGSLIISRRGVWMWRPLDLGLAPIRACDFSEA